VFFAAWTRAYIELRDSFRDDETSELREVQRELESTSKNCRILQFKLRKTERRCDQLESERADYEEKVTATEALATPRPAGRAEITTHHCILIVLEVLMAVVQII